MNEYEKLKPPRRYEKKITFEIVFEGLRNAAKDFSETVKGFKEMQFLTKETTILLHGQDLSKTRIPRKFKKKLKKEALSLGLNPRTLYIILKSKYYNERFKIKTS